MLEDDIRKAEENCDRSIEEFRQRILSGETTGDPIKDAVIVHQHTLSQEAVDTYRDLARRLAEGEGKEVLLTLTREAMRGFSGIMPPCDIGDKYVYITMSRRYTPLAGHFSFDLTREGIIIPATKSLYCADGTPWQMSGDIRINPSDALTYKNVVLPRDCPYRSPSSPQRGLMVYAGDEVRTHLRDTKEYERMREMLL